MGRSFPLGATVLTEGVNFSVFSRQATRVDLLLFDDTAATRPARVIELDARTHRTYHYWHVFVPGIGPGQVYVYRASGPLDPTHGLRFDPDKVLVDPYGRAVVVPNAYCCHLVSQSGENTPTAMKSVVVDTSKYDWEGDVPLQRPFATTVMYEMHVAGFTRHPSSGIAAELRGTYAGMIEEIPYLQDLGITAAELLPVFQLDRQDCPPGLVNCWGYSPVSFFAPHAGYSSRKDPLGPVDEFRDLVKELHRAGIEVILDVVYISGPGHGAPSALSQAYLEGTYRRSIRKKSEDAAGLQRFFKQFSFPGGIGSHATPETPGSLHEGGELGYSISHAYGTVYDHPDLITLVMVGDGESETGPLATSWHSNKFLNPITDGAVLPVLHLNGYKINNPTILARISHDELRKR